MRTIIRNGTIVTASDTYLADLLVEGEHIEAIGRFPGMTADLSIDATGKLVLPGGIDVHTHLDMPLGSITSSDDFESGTIAAACGGTTTIVDFATQSKGGRLHDALDAWMLKAEGKAVVDYGFHVIVTEVTDQVEREMDALVHEGVTSFKIFMAYKGVLMLDDGAILRVLKRSRDNGALISVHAENGDVIDVAVRLALAGGQTAPRYHARTRPPAVEGEAVRRAIALAQMAGGSLYIVHLSTTEALDAVSGARRRGVKVFAETCPQYLLLSDEKYDEPGFGAAKYVMSPPLRPPHMQEPLWRGLALGDIQVIATDHCPFRMADQKVLGRDDFSKIPNGAPGIETRMSLLYGGGVLEQRRISLNRYVEVTSTAPAKIFGLYPRKGTIAPGFDADIVVFDPDRETTVSAATHHMNVDYSLYEGWPVTGVVETVLLRGRRIVDGGRFVGAAGGGAFVPRGPCAG
jgi:dihydropyrimidinase